MALHLSTACGGLRHLALEALRPAEAIDGKDQADRVLERLLAVSRIKEEEQPITGGIALFSTSAGLVRLSVLQRHLRAAERTSGRSPRCQEDAEREVDIALMPGARLRPTKTDGIPQRWEARTSIPSIAAKDASARRSLR